jgi:F-type H+-transporting ATPase subunit b
MKLELSWSTFLLEMVNFLILVWILKRFLYKPILNIIEKRRDNIEDILLSAKKMQAEAETVQQQYEGRLKDWETEKQKNRETLLQEIQLERQNLFDQLNEELDAEREKLHVIEERRQSELQQHYQKKAFSQGARFATKLLKDVATPELENKLVDLTIDQLTQLTKDKVDILTKACQASLAKVTVSSAFPLNQPQKEQLSVALQSFCAEGIPIEYEQDSELIAGIRITMGSWVLRMNLCDELNGFTALSLNGTET